MTPESLLDHADHGRLWSHDPDRARRLMARVAAIVRDVLLERPDDR